MAEAVQVTLTLGGTAAQDMQRLAKAAEDAAKYEQLYAAHVKAAADQKQRQAQFDKAVERELASRNAPVISRDKAAGGGGGGAGGLAGLGGVGGKMAAIATAGIKMLDAGLQKAARAADLFNNSLMTRAQKMESLKDEFLPLYASFKKFAEAVDGTTDSIRMANARLQRQLVNLSAGAGANRQFRQADAQFGTPNRALLRAGRAQEALPAAGEFDRGTAVGARAEEEARAVRTAEDARRRARLTAGGAQEEQFARSSAMKDAVKAQMAGLTDAAGTLLTLREKRAAEEGGGRRNKAGINKAAANAKFNTERAQVLNETAIEEIQRRQESIVKLANAERDARQANIGVMQAELAILEQKEQRMAGFAKQLGAMNEGDFEMSKAALEAFREAEKDGSLRDLPAELGDEAAKVAPEYVAKQREKVGAERARELGKDFKGIDDSLVQDFTKETLVQVRAQVDKVRADVRVEIDLDAVKTAEAIVKDIKPVMAQLAEALRLKVRLANEGAEIDKIQKINMEGG